MVRAKVERCIGYGMTMVRVALVQLVIAATASAGPIVLDVEKNVINGRPVEGFFQFDFSFHDELDGTVLNGQSLSLDFVFARQLEARVEGDLNFDVLLVLQTNATSAPGFFGSDSTGYLLGPEGTPLHASLDPEWVGRSMSSDGSLAVGLFPHLGTFAMTGAHYDISLPQSGYGVTGGYIRLASNSPEASIRFRKTTLPKAKLESVRVPEPSVLLLLGTGLALVSSGRRFRQIR